MRLYRRKQPPALTPDKEVKNGELKRPEGHKARYIKQDVGNSLENSPVGKDVESLRSHRSRSSSPEKTIGRRLPPIPTEEIEETALRDSLDGIDPIIGISVGTPELLDILTNRNKKDIVEKLINEKLTKDEYNVTEQKCCYLTISPVLSWFRKENRNFYPVDDEQLDRLSSGEIYRSVNEIPTRLSQYSISTTAMTNVTSEYEHMFDQTNKLRQRPYSIASFNSFVNEDLKVSLKMKRFSQKAKRFSYLAEQKLDNSHKSQTSKPSMINGNRHYEEQEFGLSSLANIDSRRMAQQQQDQFFVKYHVYSYHPTQMILSTNPDRKHIYCKYAPGYVVEIQSPRLSSQVVRGIQQDPNSKRSDLGFRLLIKEQYGDETKPAIVVTKRSKAKGNGYTIWLLQHTVLDQNNQYITIDDNIAEEQYWQADLKELSNYDAFQNTQLVNMIKKTDSRKIINRYTVKDLHDIPWLIGSIPKIKKSNLNKIKNYSKDFLDPQSKMESSKISHKYDVYFFTPNDPQPSMSMKVPETLSLETKNSILALFRPHEKRIKKKLVKDLKRLKNKGVEQYYIHNSNTDSPNTLDENTTTEPSHDNEFFYQPGDGILMKNTPDDNPNDQKLGWLTIYNEPCLKTPGMFELVFGLTLAVGYERIVNIQHDG